MWLLGPVRHANVAVECIVKESMQRAPCWLLAGPLGCHEPTCQRAGVISQGGFRTRPLTNHVSSFLAGPERLESPSPPAGHLGAASYLVHGIGGFSTVRLFRLPQKKCCS